VVGGGDDDGLDGHTSLVGGSQQKTIEILVETRGR